MRKIHALLLPARQVKGQSLPSSLLLEREKTYNSDHLLASLFFTILIVCCLTGVYILLYCTVI